MSTNPKAVRQNFLQNQARPHLEPPLLHQYRPTILPPFSQNCLWRLFYGFRPSRKCWLGIAAKPNRGRYQARTSPRQPRPSPQITRLQSSFTKIQFAETEKYGLQNHGNTMTVSEKYIKLRHCWTKTASVNDSAPVVFDKNIKMANMGWAENDRVLNKDV